MPPSPMTGADFLGKEVLGTQKLTDFGFVGSILGPFVQCPGGIEGLVVKNRHDSDQSKILESVFDKYQGKSHQENP